MDNYETAEQQERLVALSWVWFEKACQALAGGDRRGHRVAALAHGMVSAALTALADHPKEGN